MARPEEVDVWVGLDVGKDEHFAEVLDDHGERLFSQAVGNDQSALERHSKAKLRTTASAL